MWPCQKIFSSSMYKFVEPSSWFQRYSEATLKVFRLRLLQHGSVNKADFFTVWLGFIKVHFDVSRQRSLVPPISSPWLYCVRSILNLAGNSLITYASSIVYQFYSRTCKYELINDTRKALIALNRQRWQAPDVPAAGEKSHLRVCKRDMFL